jgi:hypothetical protein
MSIGSGKTQLEASPVGNLIKASLVAYKGYRVGNAGGGLFNNGLGVLPALTSGSAQTNAAATATESDTIQLKTSAAGSTAFAGINESPGTNDGVPLKRLVSHVTRLQSDQNLLVRYWLGLYKNVNVLATNQWSTETPGLPFIGFHFSTAVLGQNTWQAVCIDDTGANISSKDTGILVDTSQSTLFQIVNNSQQSIAFLINGVQVSQINNRIPVATPFLMGAFVDNLNQANVRSLTVQYGAIMLG